jgi:hypothetical protein
VIRRIVLIGVITGGCLTIPIGAGAASSGTAYRWGSFAGKGDTQLSPTVVNGLSASATSMQGTARITSFRAVSCTPRARTPTDS